MSGYRDRSSWTLPPAGFFLPVLPPLLPLLPLSLLNLLLYEIRLTNNHYLKTKL
jgi:hypothetical protein